MYSVLYVDDEVGFLDLNKFLLERTGDFSVDTVESAMGALEMIRNTDYDAIVSDYNMPEMDGLALLKQVRSDYGNIPYLLFTGKGREDVVIAAVDNGVDYYIQKGTDINAMTAELRHKIKRAIDRRRMKDELERSHQRLINIINFLPDAMFVRDIHGHVIAWNKAMEKMTGVPAKEILGKGDFEYALPFYKEKHPLLIDLVLGEKTSTEPGYRYFEKAGDKITSEIFIPHFNDGAGANLWITAGPLYDAAGTVTGAIESFRDISEYYAVRQDMNVFRDMIQGFADIIPVAIYEMDLDLNLKFANRRAYSWFGFGEEDIARNISILRFISPGDRERFAADMKNIISGSESSGKEYLLLRHDETMFTAIICGAKITSPETGKPAGVRGVIIDLTERRKGAQALAESRQRLDIALTAGDVSIWDFDLRTREVRDVLPWVFRTLGYLPKDLPELTVPVCKNMVHPEDLPRILAEFHETAPGDQSLQKAQFRLACKDGGWKWVVVRFKVIEWGDSKEPVRIMGTINTITP